MLPILNKQAQVSQTLQGLYQTYGYQHYKVTNFEEYDLYSDNKHFLSSSRILSFNDMNGHLMALKPDVTLSVIKNMRTDDTTRKVWYRESVYRVPRGAYGFQEIPQTGLEYVGNIDLYAMTEVVMLAASSLQTIGSACVLQLSHMGIVTGILDHCGAEAPVREAVLDAIGGKNSHALTAACAGLPAGDRDLLAALCSLGGPADETLPRLLALPLPEASAKAAGQLRDVCGLLAGFGTYPIHIDLSVINHTDYYNGIIFNGFVDAIPTCVLSGGQYDGLLQRMGKQGGGIGFAVYLNALERFPGGGTNYDVDTLLVYTEQDDPRRVIALAQQIAASGVSVRVQAAGKTRLTYRRKINADGREVQ